jgi:hypothetical protein
LILELGCLLWRPLELELELFFLEFGHFLTPLET